MKIRKIGKYCAPFLALAMLASPLANEAQAGPSIEFGDDGQGILKIDYKAQFQVVSRDTGSGETGDDATNTMGFRRNRLAFIGAWGDMYGIYVQTDYFENTAISTLGQNTTSYDPSDDYFSLIDAQIRIKFNDMAHLRVGKFKANLTRENLEDCYQPLTLDRSKFLAEPFVISRDIGMSLWGNLVDNKVQYKIDLLEGKPAKQVSGNTGDTLGSNFRYSGRVHVSLLEPESGYGYRGTYLGTKKVLTIGAAMQHEDDLVYKNDNKDGAESYNAYTVDLFTEIPVPAVGTFTLSAAYADFDFGDRGLNSDNTLGNDAASNKGGERDGYYVKAGYMLPTLPLQIFGRMETWTFAELNGIMDHELNWMGVGANYYVRNQDVKVTLEYSTVQFDDRDTADDISTIVAQLQFMY
ncbi:MAG: OprO/OprP family phosphate-selective porin [Proteobacteria bacterium]|nr:OprO/OprP family phosphate-selective porin [Pseudomonadota bacterium]MBU1714068.1 OprO/OprP family phosphate-selective porin [Pseudomonadota bacterium]